MEVLYLSMVKPYSKVPNGGGQTFYYYINRLSRCTDVNVTLISKVLDNEDENTDIENIYFIPIRNKKLSLAHPIETALDIISKVNPYNKRGTTLRRSVYRQIEEELSKMQKAPDVVVLEFTQMLLMIDIVKKYFPNARIIASEHDVSFLRCKREMENERNFIKRIYRRIIYKTMIKSELSAISKCDVVMPHNNKDKELLIEHNVPESKIFTLVPSYKKSNLERKGDSLDIIFYGAMARKENYESAIWFINKVMPLLQSKDIRFVVVGANPVSELKALESEKVVVTGYVDDVSPYFERCLCMVAPLLSGAGIKIKVIEAMVSGVPVITNNIGIEGIPANSGVDYLHCETPQEYFEAITAIIDKRIDIDEISKSAMKIIDRFNMEQSFEEYYRHIKGEL